MTTTLYEHDLDPRPATRAELAALRRVQRGGAGGAELLVLAARQDGAVALQATQHVGVIRLAGRTIQVLPKIYRPDDGADAKRATAARNLLYLLELAGDLPVRCHDRADLLAAKADWFEVLTHLFARGLRDEWSRGPWRTYQRVEDDASPALRGTWRLAAQLRRPERRHAFAVAYDEFTADNPLNRVLRFTADRLGRLTRDPSNRRLLDDLRAQMDDVACPAHLTAADAAAVVLTRQNARFAPLLKLAQLFLSGLAIELEAGDHDSFVFMFDMNRLFELLVAGLLQRDLRHLWERKGWQLKLQDSDESLLIDAQGRKHLRLRPDVCFWHFDETPVILDTKYKRLDGKVPSEADVYQLFAYSSRYHCGHVILLYPGRDAPRHYSNAASAAPWLHLYALNLEDDLSRPQTRTAIVDALGAIIEGVD